MSASYPRAISSWRNKTPKYDRLTVRLHTKERPAGNERRIEMSRGTRYVVGLRQSFLRIGQ